MSWEASVEVADGVVEEPFLCPFCDCKFFAVPDYVAHRRAFDPNTAQMVNLTEREKEQVCAREHLRNWQRSLRWR